ncbi:MAG: TonB-dependent receptor [Saprospiraceae bacterium]|nr:TonB-dependent receptor [Saprospiraceae bacterium]
MEIAYRIWNAIHTSRRLIKAGFLYHRGFGSDGSADASNQQVLNYSWNNIATYNEAFGQSSLDLTLGFTANRETTTTQTVSGNTFADDRLKTLNSAAEITAGGGTENDVTFIGTFLRADYAFANKYLLAGSVRLDGSSRFGADSRYGIFPAVSAGWVLTQENFLANNSVFNFLKVRASYGLTGNAGIGNFDSRGLVAFGNDYNGIPGFMFDRLENPNLEWEKSLTLDGGIEFELFKSRVRGNLLYFVKDTRDLLLDVPIPWTTGIVNAIITQNAGEIRNQGFEFALDVDVLKGPLVGLWGLMEQR